MINDIRNLAAWYPLLSPSIMRSGNLAQDTAAPQIVQRILDIKLSLFLTPGDTSETIDNVDEIAVRLDAIHGDVAQATVLLADGRALEWNIPELSVLCRENSTASIAALHVYRGRDACPAANENYLVLDEDAEQSAQLGYFLHPDCFSVLQCAPTLIIGSDIAADPETAGTKTAYVDDYNMDVSYAVDTLTFNCGAGMGKGALPAEDSGHAPIGLRSINGITGSITIDGAEVYTKDDGHIINVRVPLNTAPDCDDDECTETYDNSLRYPLRHTPLIKLLKQPQ